ncbi:MAG: adenosylcobinamide-GDP ribazoletransferase [Coriobacteriia bacterium]|nr:adenosylcobinamide-GDP ribazoletransferase [Coriobacteriia bacterium]MCL2751087.1 adenosylcobinamide-GDP ribazoletransferase [Coriobacteriia bacterium]
MSALQGLVIAFSTFSGIPGPRVSWGSKGMGWALMFLPLVGICIGAALLGWFAISQILPDMPVLLAVGYTVIPILITGAIHLDGFCDTADALASNAEPPRRQQILRDPHMGAFAVIALVVYILVFFGLAFSLPATWVFVAAFASVFVLSRALGGLATLWFTSAEPSQLALSLRNPRTKTPSTVLLAFWTIASAAALICFAGTAGAVALMLSALVFIAARVWLVRQFGGFSGDLAGWLIQMIELTALAGLVFTNLVLQAL